MDILNKGLKVTPQRLAILKLLRKKQTHPTAEEVHNELSKFVEAGMLKELDIDPNKMRFDSSMNSHDHFHCRICDSVYDIVYDASISVNNLQIKKNVEGHRIDTVNINLKGVC